MGTITCTLSLHLHFLTLGSNYLHSHEHKQNNKKNLKFACLEGGHNHTFLGVLQKEIYSLDNKLNVLLQSKIPLTTLHSKACIVLSLKGFYSSIFL